MSSLTVDSKIWSLSSLCSFSVIFFFLALSNLSNPFPFFPANFFLWKAKAPPKVKAFAWLVAHKKVNANEMLQLGRPCKSFSPHWCILCMGSGELNHLFLHCLLTLGLWHKLLRLVKMVWVPSRSNCDMMTISYRGLGSSIRGKTLWEVFHSMLLYCRYANINIYWW